jgi:predicted O-linked N-acetylglucosamine transferase (SPINDLY family)
MDKSAELFRQALAALNSRDLRNAEHFCREVLRRDKSHVPALSVLSIALMSSGRFFEAEPVIAEAVRLNPGSDVSWYNYGLNLKQLNKPQQAREAFSKALQINPNVPETWNNRGTVFCDLKDYDAAIKDLDRAIALNPNYAEAYANKGKALSQLKRNGEALVAYDKALSLRPDLAAAWIGRGNLLAELERRDDALAAYDKALSISRELTDAWVGRANVLGHLRHYNEALAAYSKALSMNPALTEAWLGRGNILGALKSYDEALAAFDRVLTLKPDTAGAWLGRGNIFNDLKRYDEALAAYDKAISFDPDLAEAFCGRGDASFALNRTEQAIAAYDQALALKPDYLAALSNRIFASDFLPQASVHDQQQARAQWWTNIGKQMADSSPYKNFENPREPDRRLVLGYVSGDFRRHSAAFAFRPILRNHDKDQFEVICYACNLQEDEVTGSFRSSADRWRNASQLSDDELARQVYSDRVDILVDLSGHTDGNRLKTFARKPAPVQVTAWGHATGTGLRTIQYLFSDPVMIPESVRHLFAESIYDLPCAIIVEEHTDNASQAELPVFKNGYCTFGVLNRTTKISDQSIRTWARILAALPDAKLLIKDAGLDVAPVRTSLLEKFSNHGVSPDRIECLGFSSRDAHLATYNKVDICLDPFPQNGGVSTWEALRMGVPVVAKLGGTPPSRVCGAVLTSVGLSEWVAQDDDGYVEIALKNARQPGKLAELRKQLPSIVANSPAGNAAAYTRAVEAAYRKMWRDYCRS